MSIVLTIEDLSKLIHKSVSSIHSDLIRNPKSLPPHFKLPSSRRILFRLSDVDSWIESFIVRQPDSKRRGRPTKLAQIQKRSHASTQKAEASHV